MVLAFFLFSWVVFKEARACEALFEVVRVHGEGVLVPQWQSVNLAFKIDEEEGFLDGFYVLHK